MCLAVTVLPGRTLPELSLTAPVTSPFVELSCGWSDLKDTGQHP